MNLAKRLNYIKEELSAEERALACIRRELEGLAPDEELKETMPRSQLGDFNRLIALYFAANNQLGMSVRALTTAAGLLETLRATPTLLDKASVLAQGQEEGPPNIKGWRKRQRVNNGGALGRLVG